MTARLTMITGIANAPDITPSRIRPHRPDDQPAASPINTPNTSRTHATTVTRIKVGRMPQSRRLNRSRP